MICPFIITNGSYPTVHLIGRRLGQDIPTREQASTKVNPDGKTTQCFAYPQPKPNPGGVGFRTCSQTSRCSVLLVILGRPCRDKIILLWDSDYYKKFTVIRWKA